jgi:hypothetical protein
VKELLWEGLDEEKREWGFHLIHTLQKWNVEHVIHHLADSLAIRMATKALSQEESIILCAQMRKELLDTSFHSLLTERLLLTLKEVLQEGHCETPGELWVLIDTLSPHSRMIAREVISWTQNRILRMVREDDPLLTQTLRLIAFWERLGPQNEERALLTRELLSCAEFFWHSEEEESKGERLMEIALEISGYNPLVEKEISSFLTDLYLQAESSNKIHRLMLIYEAMERFEINPNGLASKTSLANYLADAQYLYGVRNYPAAQTHGSWVLKLDPHNQGANRLVGLCAFHLGEYEKALCCLRELQEPDEIVFKALILSQAFTLREQGRHLCQIDTSCSFDE